MARGNGASQNLPGGEGRLEDGLYQQESQEEELAHSKGFKKIEFRFNKGTF